MTTKQATDKFVPSTHVGIDVKHQHEGYDHLAINDTCLNRLAVRLALKTTARFFKKRGTCIPISRRKVVKVGNRTHLTEAVTMKFVAENSSVIVPKVHCAFVHKGKAYLVMERISGKSLSSLPEDQKQKACATLKTALKSMRDIKPPEGTGVESCCGGSLTDPRMSGPQQRFGPFRTIHDFHSWLRKGADLSGIFKEPPSDGLPEDQRQIVTDIREMIALHESPWPAPVFTHGDLNGSNILVRKDGVPVIIDWECAGWYPTYWEYTGAIWIEPVATSWPSVVHAFLDPVSPEVIKMEKTRYYRWGF